MPGRWKKRRASGGRKALVALIGATGCLAAASYAAGAHLHLPASADRSVTGGALGPSSRGAAGVVFASPIPRRRPAKPRIKRHPPKTSLSGIARFRLVSRRRHLRLRCRLDRHRWRRCRKKVIYKRLAVGVHRFRARAVNRKGRRSRISSYRWRLAAPMSFSISAQPGPLGPLYPGAAASPIPLLVTNPNSVPIYVTNLVAEVTASPPGCSAATNVALTPSSASVWAPVVVPAEGTLSLPRPGASAPAIGLLDLPRNQDACKGAQFSLAFHGSARG
jgi:hypothetical protein